MYTPNRHSFCLMALLAVSAPAFATVQISSMVPSHKSPELVGTPIDWTIKATDSNSGPLTFQFSVAPPRGTLAVVRDFNVGTLASGVWTAHFPWTPTGIEGVYQVQVVITDFASGETTSRITKFQVTPLVTGGLPVTASTSNPLVALFSAPSCPSGSSMRVSFQEQSGSTPATTTNWVSCHPPNTMTFEIAGMYPSTTYNMFSQTQTGSNTVNGSTVSFTTGAIPPKTPLPAIKVVTSPQAGADTTDSLILQAPTRLGGGVLYGDVATDLSGNIMWYFYGGNHSNILLRPLVNGTFLLVDTGTAWNPKITELQLLNQIDLAGNIIRQTNTGIIEHQLVAMGVTDATPCQDIPQPAPIGAACLDFFHHESIQTLNNGYTAVFAAIEKIFPPGTQGDNSGLPVDIIGDMIIVLDTNWQVVWYFDAFEHDDGPPQLNINRAAVLGETCVVGQGGCPPLSLLGPEIAPKAHDWLHANSLYYWPTDSQTGTTGDLVLSLRHQDWVVKIDYNNGAGTGNIIWRMGNEGDFTFNNVDSDPWPWYSHQHEVGIENNGAGPIDMFDNGNTRVSKPPLGLGNKCGPSDCNSRAMSLNYDETAMQVTPVLSQDLGVFSTALGSAQLLSNGNYFYMAGVVTIGINHTVSYPLQLLPTPGTVYATQVFKLEGPEEYRAWQMPSMYAPPIT
jgi:arylsulfate sulfotransferase